MKASEILVQARKLIEDPDHWIQGCFAEREDGTPVETYSSEACCFCAMGAVRKSGLTELGVTHARAMRFLDSAAQKTCGCNAISYNDDLDRRHGDIMHLFDVAIDLAKREEGTT